MEKGRGRDLWRKKRRDTSEWRKGEDKRTQSENDGTTTCKERKMEVPVVEG